MRKMRIFRVINDLTLFEKILWAVSVTVITVSSLLSSGADIMSVAASLIGVTALIFLARGHYLGQILSIAFAVLYGIVSIKCRYYGEAVTYLCMTAPSAAIALIEWLKHPYKKSEEVEIASVSKKQILIMLPLALIITVVFYFILKALGNANLYISTLSITTSFVASYFAACRSEYYALAYSFNDVVLIALWIIASVKNISLLPMVACFVMFLANDIYGFFSWKRMKRMQQGKGAIL